MGLTGKGMIWLALCLPILVSACAGQKGPSFIPELSAPTPVTLTEAEKQVIRRDLLPSIRNAVTEGLSLNIADAKIEQIQAVISEKRVYVCGYAEVPNSLLNVNRHIPFSGELAQSALFVRDYIGGDEAQNGFVEGVCQRRGMAISRKSK